MKKIEDFLNAKKKILYFTLEHSVLKTKRFSSDTYRIWTRIKLWQPVCNAHGQIVYAHGSPHSLFVPSQ
jgi:hypothetical protein